MTEESLSIEQRAALDRLRMSLAADLSPALSRAGSASGLPSKVVLISLLDLAADIATRMGIPKAVLIEVVDGAIERAQHSPGQGLSS